MAAAVTSVVFALVHPEWLPALLTGALWAWLLWRTRSLSACMVSHATANLALGIYVIVTGDWKYLVRPDDHSLGNRCADLPPADRHDRDDRR